MRPFPEIPAVEVPTLGHVHSAPIRVLVAEPDAVSRRLICSMVECEPEMTAECVDDSRLVSAIRASTPDIVVLDAHTPAIRRGGSWDTLGVESPPATIVTAYDPAAMERTQEAISSSLKFANSAYEAASGADALLILTEWEEFANLDLDRLNRELKYPIVIDGRNLYDPEVMAAHGFTYYSVGRAASHPDGVPAALRNGAKKA